MNLTKHIILTVFVVFFLSVFCVYGQEETSLQIVVTDSESALITQAVIKLKNSEGSLVKEIITNKSLDFIIHPLKESDYVLEIQSVGFKPLIKNINLKAGQNILKLKLEIEEIKVDVKVERDVLEKRLEDAFNRTWTIDEIESLPSNPNDIEKELKRKYGDDILIRVNGFSGGRLPPKDQIASIKVIRSSFDAEFHQIGTTIVDITTKAGLPKVFGFFLFNFDDSILNARNAFAPKKLPEQSKFFMGFLGGPIIKNKTSFTLSLFGIDSYQKNNIIAVVPDKFVENTVTSSRRMLYPSIEIAHNLNKNQTIHFNYQFEKMDMKNMGVGQFNLPETGFSSNSIRHQLRISETGVINKIFVNQFRMELKSDNSKVIPNNRTASISVLNAFTLGGAGVDNNSHQQKLYIVDNVLFDRGKQSLKFGAEIELEKRKSFSADNINGRFVFSSLTDYLNNRPATFTQRQGTSQTNVNQAQIALYLQDDIRLHRNFQIGLGLRYEWQNNLRDFNNFSPRLSFTYSPSKEGKIVFRGGTGIFYQWLDTKNLATIQNNDGRQASDLIIRNPSYPNPFVSGLISQALAPSITTKVANLVNPITYVVQTGFNYRVSKKLNIETFYKFQRGLHQFRSRDLNAPINSVRPTALFGRIAQVESSGILTENSLEIKAEGTLFKGVTFDSRYKLTKAINDFDGIFDLPVNNYDMTIEKGISNLDRRHSLTGNLNFLLFKKLQITPIFRLDSPLPYTITTGRDNNGDTVFNDRPTGFKRNSERGEWFEQFDLRVGWRIPIAKRRAVKESANNKAVAKDSKTAGAMDILKNYSIGMDVTIQNLFNHNNLQSFVGNQLSPFYRQATSAAPARQIQIGLNFFF